MSWRGSERRGSRGSAVARVMGLRPWARRRAGSAAPARVAVRAHEQYARIEADQGLMVIDALRFATPPTQTATEKTNELETYLRNNLDRMHYPAYRARGLRISSAAVESATFHVTGQRLKCQGMRWDEQGAREMAALRADLFNGR